MSAFLGPIHYWLFNKVLHIEDRAFAIAEKLGENGKADVVNAKIEEYGNRLAGSDLAALVGENPIHNFLYGLISKVEVFEAGLVEVAGDDPGLAIKTAEDRGQAAGENALSQKGTKPDDVESLYQWINDFHLEGMPCDPGAQVELLDANHLAYRHTACNHIPNWEYTGCSNSGMCAVHNAWLKGFIKGLNENASYEMKSAIADGASGCEAIITL